MLFLGQTIWGVWLNQIPAECTPVGLEGHGLRDEDGPGRKARCRARQSDGVAEKQEGAAAGLTGR